MPEALKDHGIYVHKLTSTFFILLTFVIQKWNILYILFPVFLFVSESIFCLLMEIFVPTIP